jgi:hypothetical protein
LVVPKNFTTFALSKPINMATEIQKLYELEYNEVVAISVIESDEDLRLIFSDEVKLPFNMVRTLSLENKLNEETKSLIKQLFDKIILTKEPLCEKYKRLSNQNGVQVTQVEEPKEAVVEVKKDTPKKTKLLPRRYGKAQINKDIQNQSGKATNAQLTALAVNDLKNLYVNLSNRMVHDMLSGAPILTDVEYREIRSTITILKNKMRPILKKTK